MKIFLTIIFIIIALCILSAIFIYSGIYNVSAIKPETGISKWILETTMDNSVEHHSKGIKVPNLDDSLKIKKGFAFYKEMCESCHGAPGKKETELAKGLNPPAPDLSESGQEMSSEQLFWVTKNGIKMTGMPAWGRTHSDDILWSLVAAIKKLHEISPEEYNSFSKETDEKEMEESKEQPHSHKQKIRYH